ncbi:MAG: aldo/keto reductase [Coriobacteriales bacterium]|nr:aldo/keto reductase [Coriobacteriales bacterium]
MKTVTLGSTGITTPQNGFGALPIQRISTDDAVKLVRRAYAGGMTFFDTARAYSDSEEKLGIAFEGMRDKVFIATKSMGKTPEKLLADLDTSLGLLKTDHVDIFQPHCVEQCYRPGDGTGMYEALLEAKAAGKILHIGITAHKIGVAEEIIASGLYETLQFPLSYLSGEREIALVHACAEANMGFIAMKGLAGGLLTNARACMAFMSQFDNVVPIWGIQRESELDQWLACMDGKSVLDAETSAFIEADRAQLSGNFCRGCGYCMPCPVGIQINQCARISLMVRRAPSANWLNDYWQAEMQKTTECLHCGACTARCPYELDTPRLLEENYADYKRILSGETIID